MCDIKMPELLITKESGNVDQTGVLVKKYFCFALQRTNVPATSGGYWGPFLGLLAPPISGLGVATTNL